MDGEEGGSCTNPPYLPGAGCYKYSRIGQLASTSANVGMVFLCRHKSKVKNDKVDLFNDIAVIQTNFSTGATCFFQALGSGETLDGSAVPAPESVLGEAFWLTPAEMQDPDNACIACHDNGPFLRTPYVKQEAPAAFSAARDKNEYWFPGGLGWNGHVKKVTVTGAGGCTGCHRMGTSYDFLGKQRGTAIWLSVLSTGAMKTNHLAGPSGDDAFWMKPHLHAPDSDSQEKAILLRDCALFGTGTNCTQTLFGGQTEELIRQVAEYHDSIKKNESIKKR